MKKLSLFFVFVLLFSSFVLAVDFQKQDAEECINDSTVYLNDLDVRGFNTLRIKDSLEKIVAIYDGQIAKEKKNIVANFGLVEDYCEDIKEIYPLAIAMNDEYLALTEFYKLSYVEGMDTTKSNSIIDEITLEINNERYEKVLPLVDKGYDEIFDMVQKHSSLIRFYTSTALGIKTFFVKNYRAISIAIFSLCILFLIFQRPLRRKLLRTKMKALRVRRFALKEYLKKIQKDYFDSNKISQRDYTIYSDNFSKMLRTIDKDIALMNERLIKITPERNIKNSKVQFDI